jgi:transcriptional regulator GlxA family with amidase domain
VAVERDKLEAARRMQDLIEARLDQPITLADLARAARYSP